MDGPAESSSGGMAPDEARKCSVYCLYFPNGKRYVGVESRKGRRIADHSRMASIRDKGEAHAQVVHLAIRKHGWENVKWRYLATSCTLQEAWDLERAFIRLFRARDTQWGYNRSEGGERNAGHKRRPESSARHKRTLRERGYVPRHLHTPEMRKRTVATRKREGTYGPPPATFVNTKPNATSFKRGDNLGNQNGFKRGQEAWNKGQPMTAESRAKVAASKTGRVGLPSGPNGEIRYFRPEQLI